MAFEHRRQVVRQGVVYQCFNFTIKTQYPLAIVILGAMHCIVAQHFWVPMRKCAFVLKVRHHGVHIGPVLSA